MSIELCLFHVPAEAKLLWSFLKNTVTSRKISDVHSVPDLCPSSGQEPVPPGRGPGPLPRPGHPLHVRQPHAAVQELLLRRLLWQRQQLPEHGRVSGQVPGRRWAELHPDTSLLPRPPCLFIINTDSLSLVFFSFCLSFVQTFGLYWIYIVCVCIHVCVLIKCHCELHCSLDSC